ncbi:MAG TPA: hypothetical protein VFH56_10310 [Acidimicrobiales bacterium]|nr:hypothetical protein [Acidimicrobiales bacterium]
MPPFKSVPPDMAEALLEAARDAAREAVLFLRKREQEEEVA